MSLPRYFYSDAFNSREAILRVVGERRRRLAYDATTSDHTWVSLPIPLQPSEGTLASVASLQLI